MNNTRIRYRLNKHTGLQESTRSFLHPTKGEQYSVTLDEPNLEYKVIEQVTQTEVASGRACNLHKVKIAAKAKLQEFGIVFEGETRGEETSNSSTVTQVQP